MLIYLEMVFHNEGMKRSTQITNFLSKYLLQISCYYVLIQALLVHSLKTIGNIYY